jgi:hypothetical protein
MAVRGMVVADDVGSAIGPGSGRSVVLPGAEVKPNASDPTTMWSTPLTCSITDESAD